MRALLIASIAILPVWLQGEWTRDWIERPAGGRTSTLDVHYLQTPSYFADIRIPKERPGLSGAKSFAELNDVQLGLLATQNGLAGLTAVKDDVATWSDEIAFQPSDGSPDSGRLQQIPPGQMHEIGLDGSYTESWRHLAGEKGPFLVVRVEHGSRLSKMLVVVGDRFVYVRNRAKDLPAAASMKALIESTHATREQIVGYLDCEFSTGRVSDWKIEQSTVPWREGRRLEFVDSLSSKGGLAPHVAGEDRWSVPVNTFAPRDIEDLLKPAR